MYMDDAQTSLGVSFREKDVRNMEPLQESAENSAAGYPTSHRTHRDQNFMCEFGVKLFEIRRILTHHCIREYGETLNSKQKRWGNVCIFVGQGIRLVPLPSKTQENLQDLRSKHNCLNDE